MVAERLRRCAALLWLVIANACATPPPPVVSPELIEAARADDALAISDALESLIERGAATPADREFAWDAVQEPERSGADYAFARAAVAGRLVQQRGLRGARLIAEVERWAQRSRTLDPGFRDGAATRLLGTLYVIAPASFLEQGDSEVGLELLEALARERPEVVENQLRLAEAYIALGDPDPAGPALCRCLAQRGELRRDDQQLLDELVGTVGTPDCAAPD